MRKKRNLRRSRTNSFMMKLEWVGCAALRNPPWPGRAGRETYAAAAGESREMTDWVWSAVSTSMRALRMFPQQKVAM
jgi:hypothetical protein